MIHLLFTIILGASMMTDTKSTSIHDFTFTTIDGEEKSFADFAGKKILIVNTASECGFTPQYQQLQDLHENFGDKVAIIGFPANNYGGQEPGSNKDIAKFCQKNYGVEFTMAEKVSVDGDDIHPIFKWLCAQQNDSFTGAIKWNFEKFLLDENGKLVARFRSTTDPMDESVLNLLD